MAFLFFFKDTAPTEIYTLPLHDALPIPRRSPRSPAAPACRSSTSTASAARTTSCSTVARSRWTPTGSSCARSPSSARSEEHTSELQSRQYLVCRLLLEQKKTYELRPLSG